MAEELLCEKTDEIKGKKKWDDELLLIQQIVRDLHEYDEPAQRRIIRYVSDRFASNGYGEPDDARR